MAKGFGMPVRADKSGGAALEDDPRHLATVLKLALSPGDDDNPFQSLGLDERIIFAVNDPAARGLAKNSIERILRKFSDRLTLDTSVPMQFSQSEEGKLEVSFRFIDLDTNTPTDFKTTIG